MSLDFELDRFRELLHEASEMVVRFHTDIEKKRVFHGKSPSEIHALFDEPLPREPSDAQSLLRRVEQDVFGTATRNVSPRFLAYVMSGANHIGILAELLSAALNQNCSKWHLSASATEIEQQTVCWIAEFVGYPVETGGLIVSGGSAANWTCLAVARKVKAPFDVSHSGIAAGPPLTMYTSTEVHYCIEKSLDLLGLGRNQLRKISVNDDLTIRMDKLVEQIHQDAASGYTPICIIGNGGTVNTGAVDPLGELADIAGEHNLWFHVDAAYGGPAAATATAGDLFRGMERADSVALDAHKWLYAPFEAGCALIKDQQALRDTFSMLPDYLRLDTGNPERLDMMEYGFQLSRNFKALKIWMAFQAYGAEALRSAIQENIETMRYLGSLIEKSADFELLAPVPLSAVCFRYRTSEKRRHEDESFLALLNRKLLETVEQDGRVFITGTLIRGRTALRACSVNHRLKRQDVEYLLDILRELGARVHRELRK